jgi:repressor LexA
MPKRGKGTTDELRRVRDPFHALIVQSMRRHGFREITKWADHFRIGRTTLYNLLHGRETGSGTWVTPSLETLVKLARAFDKPLHELVYMVQPDAPGAELKSTGTTAPLVESEPPPRQVSVNIAGWCNTSSQQDESSYPNVVWVEEEFSEGKELYAFKILGDSMAAGRVPIHHGDIVLVDGNDKGSNTASVVARLAGNGYVCKMLKEDRFGKLLQSRNPEHTNGTPSAIPMEQVAEIVGRVVRIIHDERSNDGCDS